MPHVIVRRPSLEDLGPCRHGRGREQRAAGREEMPTGERRNRHFQRDYSVAGLIPLPCEVAANKLHG